MKKSLAISIVLLSSGIVIGGGSTYLVHLATFAKDSSNSLETSIDSASERIPPSTTIVGDDARNPISTSDRPTDSINDPSLEQNSFQRTLEVYSYVAGLTEQQITKELQHTTGDSHEFSPGVLMELQTALVEKLAIVNPSAAVEFAIEQKDLDADLFALDPFVLWQYAAPTSETALMPFVRSVFKEWALSDLDDAVSNAKSLKKDARENALAGILEALSGETVATYRTVAKKLGNEEKGLDSYVMSFSTVNVEDPKATWDEIVKLVKPDNYGQTQVLGNIAQQWYQQDGLGVLDEINAGSLDENMIGDVVSQVLSFAATENPDQAFQYALTIPTQGRYSAPLYGVVGTWATSDPQAAYQAVTGVEQSGLRERLQQNVVSIWASNDPYYLLENQDNFPPQIRLGGISRALQKIAQTSPQEAAELALEQKEGMMGSLSYLPNQIMRYWIEQDVETAVNWVFNGPVSEEKRYNWVRALASSLVNSDPRRAFELALKQPITEGTMGMYMPALEAQIIGQIVYTDLDLAVELLAQVREGQSRSQAYSSVGNKYIDQGDTVEAVALGTNLPPDEQASYFQNIANSWVRIDPSGLVESFKNLPTAELRSSLARTFLGPWRRESFTDSQLDVLRQYLSDADRKAMEEQQ